MGARRRPRRRRGQPSHLRPRRLPRPGPGLVPRRRRPCRADLWSRGDRPGGRASGLAAWPITVGFVVAAFFVAIFPGNIAQYVEGNDAFGLDKTRSGSCGSSSSRCWSPGRCGPRRPGETARAVGDRAGEGRRGCGLRDQRQMREASRLRSGERRPARSSAKPGGSQLTPGRLARCP